MHAESRLASAHATHNASKGVDLVYTARGSRSVDQDGGLERGFRDIHVATQHVGVGSSNFELVRQYLLGELWSNVASPCQHYHGREAARKLSMRPNVAGHS